MSKITAAITAVGAYRAGLCVNQSRFWKQWLIQTTNGLLLVQE